MSNEIAHEEQQSYDCASRKSRTLPEIHSIGIKIDNAHPNENPRCCFKNGILRSVSSFSPKQNTFSGPMINLLLEMKIQFATDGIESSNRFRSLAWLCHNFHSSNRFWNQIKWVASICGERFSIPMSHVARPKWVRQMNEMCRMIGLIYCKLQKCQTLNIFAVLRK